MTLTTLLLFPACTVSNYQRRCNKNAAAVSHSTPDGTRLLGLPTYAMAHRRKSSGSAAPARRYLLPPVPREVRCELVVPKSQLGQDLASLFVLDDSPSSALSLDAPDDPHIGHPLLADAPVEGLDSEERPSAHAGVLHYYGQCGCDTITADDAVGEWSTHPSSLARLCARYKRVTTLAVLLEGDRAHSDVQLTLDTATDETPCELAHRFLLVARSGYFRALLAMGHQYVDSAASQIRLPEEFVPTLDADAEEALTIADWTALWRAADFLDVPALRVYSLHQISRRVHGLRCMCDMCVPQLPALLAFAERYDIRPLMDGCTHVLTQGFQRAWANGNFVTRLPETTRGALVQQVLAAVQPNSVVRMWRGCCELDWLLTQRTASAGAGTAAVTGWMVVVPRHFGRFLATDTELSVLLAGWDADLIQGLFEQVLALSGDDHTKIVIFEKVSALIDAEKERRLRVEEEEAKAKEAASMWAQQRQAPPRPRPPSPPQEYPSEPPAALSPIETTSVVQKKPELEISDANLHVLRDAVQTCVEYLERRWSGIAAVGGFDKLKPELVQALALAIGVSPNDLVDEEAHKAAARGYTRGPRYYYGRCYASQRVQCSVYAHSFVCYAPQPDTRTTAHAKPKTPLGIITCVLDQDSILYNGRFLTRRFEPLGCIVSQHTASRVKRHQRHVLHHDAPSASSSTSFARHLTDNTTVTVTRAADTRFASALYIATSPCLHIYVSRRYFGHPATAHQWRRSLDTDRWRPRSTQFASGLWIGVELEESGKRAACTYTQRYSNSGSHQRADGRNDGSVDGVRYFEAGANRGLFVRREAVQRAV
ncbi:hypothetical protein THASP1DRAFT_23916 [Thamnocephalis sphaerospora]|uniref:BTB domain-containing protein n=1 Tax=Thamnocephalis sphaerospora TaxID=78915 RepID=A0A4V1IWM0_9FUNG|nr:hypothetical protein THASP1DRAFT_23916 [Thamnocephalis sphaerospora]|eukprot:RKP08029.1 hypothetical protein THASP1DRAFT_23916 [Thamnocephalis sphaerospora]